MSCTISVEASFSMSINENVCFSGDAIQTGSPRSYENSISLLAFFFSGAVGGLLLLMVSNFIASSRNISLLSSYTFASFEQVNFLAALLENQMLTFLASSCLQMLLSVSSPASAYSVVNRITASVLFFRKVLSCYCCLIIMC